MRARELRFRRSFRRIVAAVLASPLAAVAGCHSAGGEGGPDATVPDRPDATADASAVGLDAGPGEGGSIEDGEAPIGDACGSFAIDGAFIEGNSDGCVAFQQLPCGLPASAKREGCVIDLATCTGPCGAGFFLYCQLAPISCNDAGDLVDDASTVIECVSCQGITGRRPLGLAPSRTEPRSEVGDYFARMAHLESASVRAFRDLEGWLAAHGAPPGLVRGARRSAEDERRHARAARRMAARFAGVTTRPRVRRVPPPTLGELLEDDAVEGCVNEAFGALVATWQASRAKDPRVRRTLARIARDETRHGALAWDILAWGLPLAPRAERERVICAAERALRRLEKTRTVAAASAALREVAGHPGPDEEAALAGRFVRLAGRELRRTALLSADRRRTEPTSKISSRRNARETTG